MTGKTAPVLAAAFAAAALASVQPAAADVARFGAMAFAAKSAADGPRTVGNVLKKALGKALRLSEEAAGGVISGDAARVRKAEAGLDGFMGGVLAEEMTELRTVVRIHEAVGSAGAGLKRMAKAAGERVGRFFGRVGAAVDGRIALARDPGGAGGAPARSIFASKPLPKANLAVLSTPSRRRPPPASAWTRKGTSDPWGSASAPADPWARPSGPSETRAAGDPAAAAEPESRRTGRDGYKAALRTTLNLEEGPAPVRRGYNEELAALEREAARRAEEARRREQERLAEERRERERIAARNRETARRDAEARAENWNMFVQGLQDIARSYVEAQQRQHAAAAARQREARLRAERRQQERRRQEEARQQAESLRQEGARQRAENLRREEMERQRRAEARRRAEEERRRAEAQRRAEEERRREAERQARGARRQACRARISGSRTGCVKIVRWTVSDTYHFRNTCGYPIFVRHRELDSAGGWSRTRLAPGAAGRTAPVYADGTKRRGIEYTACFDDPGVDGSCQLLSRACQ